MKLKGFWAACNEYNRAERTPGCTPKLYVNCMTGEVWTEVVGSADRSWEERPEHVQYVDVSTEFMGETADLQYAVKREPLKQHIQDTVKAYWAEQDATPAEARAEYERKVEARNAAAVRKAAELGFLK